ncbi:MAG: ABC transporter substrate-binding protein [Candidatus Sedimenticola sp. PURPLELP]
MIGTEVDMPGKRTLILIAVLLLGTGLLSGCDRWFEDDSHQLLRIGHQSNISTLDQYATTMRSTLDMGYLIWDPLLARDPDTGSIKPHLVTRWEVIEPTVWRFKLREGVSFHNGNPLTAEAVRFTVMDYLLKSERSQRKSQFDWISNVRVIDEHTFEIHTSKPYPLILERLNTLFPYDPSVAITDEGPQAWVGTGPYRLVRFDPGSEVVLSANKAYWRTGYPKIDNLQVRMIADTEQRLEQLLNGNLDLAMNLSPDHWSRLTTSKGISAMDIPVLRIVFWQFDSMGRASETPLTDPRVRQAIWHAIDTKAIVDKVFGSRADPLDSPVNPVQFGFVSDLDTPEYSPVKARRLLRQAGYAKGFDIKLWYYLEEQHLFNLAAKEYLEQVGIRLDLQDYRGRQRELGALYKGGKVDGIANYTWGSYNLFDVDGILPDWFMLDRKYNYTGDSRLSGWLRQARFEVGHFKRKALYDKAVRRIVDQAYWMPNYVMHRIWGRRSDLNLVVGRDEVARLAEASYVRD